jgi:hypothetical protein
MKGRYPMRAHIIVVVATLSLSSQAPAQAQRAGQDNAAWDTFVESSFGTQVEYPTDLFSISEGPSERGIGEHFRTADGRARLLIYSLPNDTRATPARFLRSNLKASRIAVDYQRVTASFFAISGSYQGTIYYSRCNFSSNAGGAVHCFDLKYPEREKRAWDDIVTRISRSLRPLVG